MPLTPIDPSSPLDLREVQQISTFLTGRCAQPIYFTHEDGLFDYDQKEPAMAGPQTYATEPPSDRHLYAAFVIDKKTNLVSTDHIVAKDEKEALVKVARAEQFAAFGLDEIEIYVHYLRSLEPSKPTNG